MAGMASRGAPMRKSSTSTIRMPQWVVNNRPMSLGV